MELPAGSQDISEVRDSQALVQSTSASPSVPPSTIIVTGISILLLTSCFTASCLVTQHGFAQLCKDPEGLAPLNHTQVSCLRERSQVEGRMWSCCPQDWRPFQTSCYFFPRDVLPWNEAQSKCLKQQAHLVVINTEAEKNFITQGKPLNSSIHLGLKKRKKERQWRWEDKTPYNPADTFGVEGDPQEGDPALGAREERCAVLTLRQTSSRWRWSGTDCVDATAHWICEMPRRSF
ncbi:C-type lectin domain family 4 member D-like isoform X1 [Ornithorhynchus anatinus]|uniref:C-type lectin domain family 4 member D-like isoform X1 n=1 Tax=Ornithorhynchus anatinus TaxID=9258 RepID=UPI0010A9205A|nr:C-type lectin domain family 4 member D-like isoform X1 [Ornithorhynchus anatinus]